MMIIRFITISSLILFASLQANSQDNRTFWQKIFGKKKSEKIDSENPQNSQDSLAVLLQDHLLDDTTEEQIDTVSTNIIETSQDSDKTVSSKKGITVSIAPEITPYLDTVTKIDPKGYRIQVFMGDLSQARRIRSALLDEGWRVTMDYNRSEYVVRVGDYRTFMEAQKALQGIKESYSSAYVIKDKIKL